MMKNLLLLSFLLHSITTEAQKKVDIEGALNVNGQITGTGATIEGSTPVRITTSATTILDLRANNPLIEFRDNAALYKAFIQIFGDDLYISNRVSGRLLLRTNNVDRLMINALGNVGIGNSLPSSKLTINGLENNGAVAGLELNNNNQKLIMDGNEIDCVTGSLYLNYNSMHDLLFRTNTRRAELTMLHNTGSGVSNGFAIEHPGSNNAYWTMYATNADGNFELYYKGSFKGEFNSSTGAYTQISDRRLKENIAPIKNILSRIKLMKPSVYNFRDDSEQNSQVGFIAQEVDAVFPELVQKGTIGDTNEEVYTMDYGALGVIAIAAIQELMELKEAEESDLLLSENQALKLQLKNLEARLLKLEEKIGD